MTRNEGGYKGSAGKLSIRTGWPARRVPTAAILPARPVNLPRLKALTWHGGPAGSAIGPRLFLLSAGRSLRKTPGQDDIFLGRRDSVLCGMRGRRSPL